MENLSTKIHMSHSSETNSTNDKVKLKKYLSEMVAHLTTIEGSKEDMKQIVEIAVQELGKDDKKKFKKSFEKAAKIIQKNKNIADETDALDAVQDIIDKVSTIS